MDTVRSWLDADEVRRMAEGLMESSQQKEGASSDAEKEALSDGHAESSQISQIKGTTAPESDSPVPTSASQMVSSALASARKVAEGSGMLQSATNSKPPELVIPRDEEIVEEKSESIGEVAASVVSSDIREFDPVKLCQLSDSWAKSFSFKSMVVMATDSEVLVDTLANSKITQMAQKLALAVPAAGHLFVRIGAGSSLQVISVSTEHGDLIVGALVTRALPSDQVDLFASQVAKDMGL